MRSAHRTRLVVKFRFLCGRESPKRDFTNRRTSERFRTSERVRCSERSAGRLEKFPDVRSRSMSVAANFRQEVVAGRWRCHLAVHFAIRFLEILESKVLHEDSCDATLFPTYATWRSHCQQSGIFPLEHTPTSSHSYVSFTAILTGWATSISRHGCQRETSTSSFSAQGEKWTTCARGHQASQP